MNDASRAPTDVELQLLPPLIRLVAKAAGVERALAFAAKHGGLVIYVPKVATPEHPLAADIGLAGLQALCAEFEGPVSVPKALRAVLAVRNQRMRRQRAEASIRDLAQAYQLDRRRVQQIMAEPCGQLADDQPDLFA